MSHHCCKCNNEFYGAIDEYMHLTIGHCSTNQLYWFEELCHSMKCSPHVVTIFKTNDMPRHQLIIILKFTTSHTYIKIRAPYPTYMGSSILLCHAWQSTSQGFRHHCHAHGGQRFTQHMQHVMECHADILHRLALCICKQIALTHFNTCRHKLPWILLFFLKFGTSPSWCGKEFFHALKQYFKTSYDAIKSRMRACKHILTMYLLS